MTGARARRRGARRPRYPRRGARTRRRGAGGIYRAVRSHRLSTEEDWRFGPDDCRAAYDALEAPPTRRLSSPLPASAPFTRRSCRRTAITLMTPAPAGRAVERGRGGGAVRARRPRGLPFLAADERHSAKVAGVERLVVTTPTPQGQVNQLVLAAAHIARGGRGVARGRRAGDRRFGLWHQTHRAGGRGHGPGKCVGGRGQAPALRRGRHRHGGRAERDPGHQRQQVRSRLDRRRPAQPGRARPLLAIDPHHR